MRAAARRTIGTAAAALALAAAGVTVADPAAACSCPTRYLQPELAKGNALAIVSVEGPEFQTLRVLRSAGGDLPPTLDVRLLAGSSCQPWRFPGRVAALIVDRHPTWRVLACAEVPLGEAFTYLDGAPAPEAGGPPVAVVLGDFGGSRIAAMDADGRTVAWDGRSGSAAIAAVCPGNRTLLAVGLDHRVAGASDLSVHDLDTLRVRRTVPLPARAVWNLRALTCGNADGGRALAIESSDSGRDRVLVLDGDRVSHRPIPKLAEVAAHGTGLIGLIGDTSPQALVVIGSDGVPGARIALPASTRWLGLAVAPAGDLVAVQGKVDPPREITPDGFAPQAAPPVELAMIDVAEGTVLVQRQIDTTTGGVMGWTRGGHLLLWSTSGGPGSVLEFDRRIVEQARRPGLIAAGFAVVGDAAVGYGSTRLVLAEPGRAAVREVGPPRLGAAGYLVAVPARGFTPPGSGAAAPSEPADRRAIRDGAVAAAALIIAGAVLLAHRRRRSRRT